MTQQSTPVIAVKKAETLGAIWQQHTGALQIAAKSAAAAEPLEASAESRRSRAATLREDAARMVEEAASLEASANSDATQAANHRSEQTHHEAVAEELAKVVSDLASANGIVHPAEMRRRAEEAAANAAQVRPQPFADPGVTAAFEAVTPR